MKLLSLSLLVASSAALFFFSLSLGMNLLQCFAFGVSLYAIIGLLLIASKDYRQVLA